MVFTNQSELVYMWYRRLCVLVWLMDGLRLDSTALHTPFAKCWQLNRTSVQAAHSRSLSRRLSPLKTQLIYNDWKKNSPSKGGEDSSEGNNPSNPCQDGHVTSSGHTHPSPSYRRQKREAAIREEEKLRRRKKLTAAQMEALVKTVDEELNFSKRKNRARIQRLLQQSQLSKKQAGSPSSSPPPPSTESASSTGLDVGKIQEQFSETELTKTMTVHHQLSAMDRHRNEALEQRLASLKARHSLWEDLSLMRQGVEIETTEMARKKLLMNFNWYPDLLSQLPDSVKMDRYCQRLLDLLDNHYRHSSVVGPKQWSKKRLINILSTLRPWELRSPETAVMIEFMIRDVIYILPEDYDQWLAYHTATHMTRR